MFKKSGSESFRIFFVGSAKVPHGYKLFPLAKPIRICECASHSPLRGNETADDF
jgi:hypothetical protein